MNGCCFNTRRIPPTVRPGTFPLPPPPNDWYVLRRDLVRMLAAKAERPTTTALDPDSPLDDVIAKLNVLIRQLKGVES